MRLNPLYHELKKILDTAEPATLDNERRSSALSIAQLDHALTSALQDLNLTRSVKELIRAAAYLWHDHLGESHTIAQEIETPDGSLVHAIMHRREPDYGNSKYWFRRVGSHPSFLSLATRAGELLEKADETDLQSRLLPNKTWDPFAFVDAVEDALGGQFKSKVPLLREIQKLEFDCFFENLSNRA